MEQVMQRLVQLLEAKVSRVRRARRSFSMELLPLSGYEKAFLLQWLSGSGLKASMGVSFVYDPRTLLLTLYYREWVLS